MTDESIIQKAYEAEVIEWFVTRGKTGGMEEAQDDEIN